MPSIKSIKLLDWETRRRVEFSGAMNAQVFAIGEQIW